MKRSVLFFSLLIFVVVLSSVSVNLWSDKKEDIPQEQPLVVEPGMTLTQFGEANGLAKAQLKDLFGLESPDQLTQTLESLGMDRDTLEAKVRKSGALSAEYQSKNWIKIPVKFGTWVLFLGMVFVLMRRGSIDAKVRKWLYFTAVTVFGVILSSDPSPMGTVKDAIHLYAAEGVIFPPRLVALSVFLIIVVAANKYICAWGCQFGTLQDLIFRLNRDAKDRKGAWPQFKLPFVFTNSVRMAFLVVFTIVAFAWGLDIIELFDPFKIFKPQVLGVLGMAVIGGLVVASLFVYRPWCTMFCPFGLVGWMCEKLSVHKIKVDYETCIACEACAKACPSTVMEAILKRETKVIPDCFSCATCMSVCPTKSITFGRGARDIPPKGKFDKDSTE